MFVGSSRFSATLSFVRDPERFIKDCTAKWGLSWYFYLAGRKVLVTGDSALAQELFSNSDAMFFPDPIFSILGKSSVLFQTDEDHTKMRTLLRTSFSGVALAPIADHEAQRMCQEVLDPLRGPIRIDLMPGIRKYLLHATLQMLTGNLVPRAQVSKEVDRFKERLHPFLLMPIHPWCRFSMWGKSPWDRFVLARDQIRETLLHLATMSTEGYPANRLWRELSPSVLVDQLLTLTFSALDNPSITLAWMLKEFQKNPEEQGSVLLNNSLDNHPSTPLIPHNLRIARPDLGLDVGDGVALAPGLLKDRSAFGMGPHRCLGMAWTQVLMLSALRALRPYLINHKITLGPSVRQSFSWGPSQIWLHS